MVFLCEFLMQQLSNVKHYDMNEKLQVVWYNWSEKALC